MVRGEGDLAVEVLASPLMNFSPPSVALTSRLEERRMNVDLGPFRASLSPSRHATPRLEGLAGFLFFVKMMNREICWVPILRPAMLSSFQVFDILRG